MWQLTPRGSWKKQYMSFWPDTENYTSPRKNNVPLYLSIHLSTGPEGGKLWSSYHHLKPKEMTATDRDGGWKGCLQQADAPSQVLGGIQLWVYHEKGPLANFNSELWCREKSLLELKTSGKEPRGGMLDWLAPGTQHPMVHWPPNAPQRGGLPRLLPSQRSREPFFLNNWIAVQKALSSFHRSIRAFKYFRITGLCGGYWAVPSDTQKPMLTVVGTALIKLHK